MKNIILIIFLRLLLFNQLIALFISIYIIIYFKISLTFLMPILIIKLVELNDYIDFDELPDFLDGTCDLPYKTVPKDVPSAHDLAEQLSIGKSAAHKLIKHLEPYIIYD